MRSNSRGWSGWMRSDRGGAEELPIHAQAEFFSLAQTGLETTLLAGSPHRGITRRQWMSMSGSSSIRRLKDCPVVIGLHELPAIDIHSL